MSEPYRPDWESLPPPAEGAGAGPSLPSAPTGGPPIPPAVPPAGPVSTQVRRHPHAAPQPYALILRTWTYATWRPIVGLIILVLGMFMLGPLLAAPILLIAVAIDYEGSYATALQNALDLDSLTWQGLLWLNLTLAVLIPVVWLILRWLHQMRPRWAMSVKPGIRWGFFWACFGVSVIAMLAQIFVSLFLPADVDEFSGSLAPFNSTMLAFILVVVLTTPLQAMAEEYIFRGYGMQAFGAIAGSAWFAIIVTALLFALAHGAQNVPLFLDRFTFGLIAGYLVHATGGLEAGIALHIWNNLFAFGFAIAFGVISESVGTTEVSWWNIILTLTQNGVYLVLVLLIAKSMRIGRYTQPPLQPETASLP